MNKISNDEVEKILQDDYKYLQTLFPQDQIFGIFTYGDFNYGFAETIKDLVITDLSKAKQEYEAYENESKENEEKLEKAKENIEEEHNAEYCSFSTLQYFEEYIYPNENNKDTN